MVVLLISQVGELQGGENELTFHPATPSTEESPEEEFQEMWQERDRRAKQ